MISSVTLFKVTALFFGFYSLQMLLVPDFFMSENFTGYTLDKWHYFLLRGLGAALLNVSVFTWQAAGDADKFMLRRTVSLALFIAVVPLYSQFYLTVTLMQGVGLFLSMCILAAHAYCAFNLTKKSK